MERWTAVVGSSRREDATCTKGSDTLATAKRRSAAGMTLISLRVTCCGFTVAAAAAASAAEDTYAPQERGKRTVHSWDCLCGLLSWDDRRKVHEVRWWRLGAAKTRVCEPISPSGPARDAETHGCISAQVQQWAHPRPPCASFRAGPVALPHTKDNLRVAQSTPCDMPRWRNRPLNSGSMFYPPLLSTCQTNQAPSLSSLHWRPTLSPSIPVPLIRYVVSSLRRMRGSTVAYVMA